METIKMFILAYVFLLGLIFGSFLNVLIYRIPLKLSPEKGFSFCPACKHRLHWYDLFPLFSYIFLRGKCRYCKAKISLQYPIVEFLNALCFLLVYLVYGLSVETLLYMVCCSCLIVVTLIDFKHMIIPDRFNIIILACGLIALFAVPELGWLDRVIGMFAFSVPVFLLSLMGAMGAGDAKLLAAIGLLLGWKLTLLTFVFAALLASIFGIASMIKKKADGKLAIPFGPFISLAAIIAILYGQNIISAYLSLFLK